MTQESVAVPAKEFYAKRARNYLAERGLAEEVLAAVSVEPPGVTQARFRRSVGGAVGAVAGGAAADALGPAAGPPGLLSVVGGGLGRQVADDVSSYRETPIGRPTSPADILCPKNGLLVLTSGRLLVFTKTAMGLFSSKPKAAHSDIPLSAVHWVSEPVEASFAGRKSIQVAVVLRSGALLRVEFLPVAVKNGLSVMAELARRIEGAA